MEDRISVLVGVWGSHMFPSECDKINLNLGKSMVKFLAKLLAVFLPDLELSDIDELCIRSKIIFPLPPGRGIVSGTQCDFKSRLPVVLGVMQSSISVLSPLCAIVSETVEDHFYMLSPLWWWFSNHSSQQENIEKLCLWHSNLFLICKVIRSMSLCAYMLAEVSDILRHFSWLDTGNCLVL